MFSDNNNIIKESNTHACYFECDNLCNFPSLSIKLFVTIHNIKLPEYITKLAINIVSDAYAINVFLIHGLYYSDKNDDIQIMMKGLITTSAIYNFLKSVNYSFKDIEISTVDEILVLN